MHHPERVPRTLALAILLGLTAACAGSDGSRSSTDAATTTSQADVRPDSVYEPPSELDGEPGEVILDVGFEADEFAAGVAGRRILYQSTDEEGALIGISGVVFLPEGEPPAGGWPILAWAHGTTGVADECAPSRNTGMFGYAEYVGDLVREGFVVVASDYEGLGTPGPHPYLDKEAEGLGVIDGVTAARSLLERDGIATAPEWVVVGHSQGGQAAMAAAELDVDGNRSSPVAVVAIAPASQLPLLPDYLRGTPLQGYLAFAAAGIVARDSSVTYDDLFGPIGIEKVGVLDDGCWTEVMEAYATVPEADTRDQTPEGLAAIERFLDANEPGTEPMGVPILLVQGDADDTVPLAATELLQERLCGAGESAELTVYPGSGHDEVLDPSRPEVVSWVTERFAGSQPTGCP